MPPVVAAAIVTGIAGVGATVYGTRANNKANERATQVEDKRITEANVIEERRLQQALEREEALEERRRLEVDRQFDEEQRQWDANEAEFEPYRQASMGAMGSLKDLISQLSGGKTGLALEGVLGANAPRDAARPRPTRADVEAQMKGSTSWRPAETIRTGRPAFDPAAYGRPTPVRQPAPVSDVGRATTDAAGKIADIIQQLSMREDNVSGRARRAGMSTDAYIG